MNADSERAIVEAHAEAQARFAAMVRARSYADPDAPETRAYIAAERLVDDLLANAAWERGGGAEMAAEMAERRPAWERAVDDEVMRLPVHAWFEGHDWSEAELREAWGR